MKSEGQHSNVKVKNLSHLQKLSNYTMEYTKQLYNK